MIELKEICKSWKEFQLKDVNLKINKDYCILLGPSGAGKSIIMKCIAGILEPDSGRIYFNDNDITHVPPEKRNFGYVPQNYGLFPHMNAYKNIRYGLKLKKIGKLESEKRIGEISEFLNISKILHRYPEKLSGGEKQRVALARALVLKPEILLLDEPTSSLDISNKENIICELKKIGKVVPIIHITHDFVEAKTLGKNIVIVMNGKIEDSGNNNIFKNPKNEKLARFFGYNIINETDGRKFAVSPENVLIEKSHKIDDSHRDCKSDKYLGIICGIVDFGHYKKLEINLNGTIVKSIYFGDENLNEQECVWVNFKNKIWF
jgi:molybdate/tungstate transport system ATP-binding protein